jgi:hypothetical protein
LAVYPSHVIDGLAEFLGAVAVGDGAAVPGGADSTLDVGDAVVAVVSDLSPLIWVMTTAERTTMTTAAITSAIHNQLLLRGRPGPPP